VALEGTEKHLEGVCGGATARARVTSFGLKHVFLNGTGADAEHRLAEWPVFALDAKGFIQDRAGT